MADSTEASIVIEAPADVVMSTIADVMAYPEWADGVRAVTVVEHDADGRPSVVTFEVSSGPVSGQYTVAYDWGADAVSWSLVESNILRDLDGSYALTADADGTAVTYRLRITPTIPLIGPLRRRAERQIVDTALQDLGRAAVARA